MNSTSSKEKCKHFRELNRDMGGWVCVKCGDVLPDKDLEEKIAKEEDETKYD